MTTPRTADHRNRKPPTRKRMLWMLLAAGVVFGGLFFVKWFGAREMNKYFDNMAQPPAAITAARAQAQVWTDSVDAVGTLVAVNGTQVTTEAGGVVAAIRFESGSRVRKGDVLLTLNVSNEAATLRALEAAAKLAATQRDRYRELYDSKRLVAKADLEQRESEAASTLAQAEAQRALIAQKTIRAPFDGVLGIRQVDLGQFLNPGDPIVSLQSLDPIYLNFTLPEQRLPQVHEGMPVAAEVESRPGKPVKGTITAIEPRVDPDTRNFQVQATLANPGDTLRPGTFARVNFALGGKHDVIVVPQTAISFNPYGNSVYVISPAPPTAAADAPAAGAQAAPSGQPQWIVKQRFVRTGATRGDLIAISAGLKPGERVATSGLLKLRNDASVIINNQVRPTGDATPTPDNS